MDEILRLKNHRPGATLLTKNSPGGSKGAELWNKNIIDKVYREKELEFTSGQPIFLREQGGAGRSSPAGAGDV